MTIYADEMFAANALSFAMLIYSYCAFKRIRPNHIRIIGGAAVCGLYSVAELLFGLPYFLRAAALAGIVYICLGRYNIVSHIVGILLLSFAAMGITLAAASMLGMGAELIKGSAVIFAAEPIGAAVYVLSYPVYLLAQRIKRIRNRYVHITLLYNGRKIKLCALYDSGNLLKYHNKPVLLVSWDVAAPLFDFSAYSVLRDNAEQYVIYETVSGLGTLPVIEPQKCLVGGTPRELAAAVTEKQFSGKYGGIIGDMSA